MIGSCPECKEAIRIPEGSLNQQVRCPLCSAEYELEQVFDQLPPMLEIVGSSSEGIGIQIESGNELDLTQADSSDASSPSPKYQPQKRKQTNAFAEILKVVLGGALALPIGVLCVWWFAGRAPFGFAEKVSEYAPWIVPEKLRKGDKIDDSDLDASDDESDDEKRSNAVNAFKQNANRNIDKEPVNQGVLGITKSVEGDKKKSKNNGGNEKSVKKNDETNNDPTKNAAKKNNEKKNNEKKNNEKKNNEKKNNEKQPNIKDDRQIEEDQNPPGNSKNPSDEKKSPADLARESTTKSVKENGDPEKKSDGNKS